MDFAFTEKQQKLRQDVHTFFMKEVPADYQSSIRAVSKEVQAVERGLERKMAKKGWLTPGWPKQLGGLALTNIEQGIVDEEAGYWVNRWPDTIGIHLLGPILLLHGTEEQKKKFIPGIVHGEDIWFECFTERTAGSDEANVQLKAVAEGNDFVLNGDKMFNGNAYKPDYLVVLTRTVDTTPKHRGLSLIIVPGNAPGVTYRRLECMGGHTSNELFFRNVRVPKENLVGELNRGFYYAMSILEFERTSTGMVSNAKRTFEEFVQFCKDTKRNGKALIDEPDVRDKLAQMAIELEVWRLAAWKAVWWFDQREKLGPQPYDLSGFYYKKNNSRHPQVMMDILGAQSQLRSGSKGAPLGGSVERLWLRAQSLHAGGTVEILKNVLAQRGLGLPRRARAKTQG